MSDTCDQLLASGAAQTGMELRTRLAYDPDLRRALLRIHLFVFAVCCLLPGIVNGIAVRQWGQFHSCSMRAAGALVRVLDVAESSGDLLQTCADTYTTHCTLSENVQHRITRFMRQPTPRHMKG